MKAGIEIRIEGERHDYREIVAKFDTLENARAYAERAGINECKFVFVTEVAEIKRDRWLELVEGAKTREELDMIMGAFVASLRR